MSRKIHISILFLTIVLSILLSLRIVPSVFAQEDTSLPPSIETIIQCLFFGVCTNTDENAPPPYSEPGDEPFPTVPIGIPPPIPTPDQYLSAWQQKMYYGCFKIYSLIAEKCQNYATTGNGCYDKIQDDDELKNTTALWEIHHSLYDIPGVSALQCVGLVRACAAFAGAPLGPGKGAASNYRSPPPGYQFIAKGKGTIKVGDIPIWTIGKYGHIAVVVAIESENNFQVVEANLLDQGAPGDPYNNGFVQLRSKHVNPPRDSSDPSKILRDTMASNLAGWLRRI